jgi:hypothetical protein
VRNATFNVVTERMFSALKVARMYPLAVLLKGSWREGKSLGSEAGRGMRSGIFEVVTTLHLNNI